MDERLGTFEQWQLRHASTPADVVADLVERATGSSIDRTERLLEGYLNEVHRVSCADGQDVVVRFLRFDDEDLAVLSADEAHVISLARDAGVPAPEVLLLDTVRVGDETYPAMVQRAVAGRPLRDVLPHLTPERQRSLLEEVGAVVARLHAVAIDLEREWTPARRRPNATRTEARETMVGLGIADEQANHILDLLDDHLRATVRPPWVLCHGDLSTQHVYATQDVGGTPHVSGLIDFGDWLPGRPVHDLAILRIRSSELPTEPILAGYGADDDLRQQLDLHTAAFVIDTIRFCESEGDEVQVRRLSALLREAVSHLVG